MIGFKADSVDNLVRARLSSCQVLSMNRPSILSDGRDS